jgi:beta-phosphoglucomutase
MNIKACIFDLDGVIVDTAKYHYLAWKRLADKLGIVFNENINERLKGVSRIDSLEIILELSNRSYLPEQKAEFAARKNAWYIDYINRMTPAEILPGSSEFIAEIKKADIKVAIGSASKNTPLLLERVGLNEMFDAVADGNLVKKAKPDPEVFLKAAEMLKVKNNECVVFEDAAAGVKAAINAGMKCVGIGSQKILGEADLVIAGLNEMSLEKLKSL